MQTESANRSYTINFADQVKDGLITSADMISYFQSKLKVKNCLKIAAREVSFEDNNTSIVVTSKAGSIIKKNMKLYIKRFLRNKSLKNFIKVSGDNKDSFNLVYINTVDETEE